MNYLKHAFLVSAVLFASFVSANAQENTQPEPPPKYKMEVVRILYTDAVEYIFVIGNLGFKSVDSLKKFLGTLPPNSELEWAPSCRSRDDEPLRSSETEMEKFKQFCRDKNIKFVLRPTG